MPIRVIIVDDQALFREGLRTLLDLSEEVEIVGEGCNGQDAIDLVDTKMPQVVLMDLNMPGMDGVEATSILAEKYPFVKTLVLTTFDDDQRVFDALKAGALGYLLKDTSSDRLIEAIETVNAGGSFLQPSIASKVVAELNRLSRSPRPRGVTRLAQALSTREEEVLIWLSEGFSNKEIASKLDLAEGTVKNHVSNILGKLEVMDRTQAALKARDLGIV